MKTFRRDDIEPWEAAMRRDSTSRLDALRRDAAVAQAAEEAAWIRSTANLNARRDEDAGLAGVNSGRTDNLDVSRWDAAAEDDAWSRSNANLNAWRDQR